MFLISLAMAGCSDTTPFLREQGRIHFGEIYQRPAGADVITFYALGDWGTGKRPQYDVAAKLRENVASVATRSVPPFVVGLGDNVYEHGLPNGWLRKDAAVDLLHQTFGEVYRSVQYDGMPLDFHIVPGNHDYAGNAKSRSDFGDVLHQETTAEAIYPFWKYYPIDPVKNLDTNDSTDYRNLSAQDIYELALPQQIELAGQDKLAIFAIDTQVILELYEKKQDDLLKLHWQRLDSLVSTDNSSWKMIIGHHPIRSHGKHGGFTRGFWWIPPLTIVPIIDKLFVKRLQDLDHKASREFQKRLAAFMREKNVTFYLTGHDHSLQFIGIDDDNFQVISGSAAKLSGTTHKADTFFSNEARGFVRFDVTANEVWIEFITVSGDDLKGVSPGLFRLHK